MRLPRMTTQRWMILIAAIALLLAAQMMVRGG
jgi:hypothetical protein